MFIHVCTQCKQASSLPFKLHAKNSSDLQWDIRLPAGSLPFPGFRALPFSLGRRFLAPKHWNEDPNVWKHRLVCHLSLASPKRVCKAEVSSWYVCGLKGPPQNGRLCFHLNPSCQTRILKSTFCSLLLVWGVPTSNYGISMDNSLILLNLAYGCVRMFRSFDLRLRLGSASPWGSKPQKRKENK